MTSDHKTYDPIPDVVGFDSTGAGPFVDLLTVTANVSPNLNYPECRISLCIGSLAVGALTVEQSVTLRGLLERAERDVHEAVAAEPLIATGIEGRCESCSMPVSPGEPIVIEDEGTDDRVVLHAGMCPGEERADG